MPKNLIFIPICWRQALRLFRAIVVRICWRQALRPFDASIIPIRWQQASREEQLDIEAAGSLEWRAERHGRGIGGVQGAKRQVGSGTAGSWSNKELELEH